MDFDRSPPFETPALGSLAGKIRVQADSRLEVQYPETWPARVVVERSGKLRSAFVGNPHGDARNPIEWKDVLVKAGRYRPMILQIRTTTSHKPVHDRLLDALP